MVPSLPGISSSPRAKLFGSLSLFLLTFLVYLRTLAPGVYGFDSAELAAGVFTQGVIHPPGYPLYLLIGKLFTFLPFGDVAYRLNLMSAFFASITVVILFWVVEMITESPFAAWASAFLFAVSNYFWQMALVAEVYTPFTAFLAGDLLAVCLWRKTGSPKYLLLFSLLYGLTLTIHTSGILFVPAFAWLILGTRHWKSSHWRLAGVMVLLFLIGLSPYAYLSLRAGACLPIDYSRIYSGVDITTLPGLWWLGSGRAYVMFAFGYPWRDVPTEFLNFTAYLWRNFLGVGAILGAIGIAWLWRKSWTWAVGLLLMFMANALFYVNYRVMDKDTMFLPAYLIWAIFVAGGITVLDGSIKLLIRRGWLEPRLKNAGRILPILFIGLGLILNWRWVDMSDSDGYALFAGKMMSETPPHSVIIAPWSSAVVLEYYQVVEGQRPDLLIVNRSRRTVARYYELWRQGLPHEEILARINLEEVDFIDRHIQQEAVYAVEYDPVLANKFEYLPEGPIFRLAIP